MDPGSLALLLATLRLATPLGIAAMGELVAERSGVLNIGIEGMLLGGAFMGALIGSSLGPWVGILAGMATGGLLALGLAVLAHLQAWEVITFRARVASGTHTGGGDG